MRRRGKPDTAQIDERVALLETTRAELAATYSLPATDPRIEQVALVKLNQRNWEHGILVGRPVPAAELQAYTDTIAQLLGPPPTPLTVRFVEAHLCPRCQADTTPEAAAAKAKAEAKAEARAAAAPVSAQPSPPAASPPANVLPLRKPELARPAAPLLSRGPAPYTDITAGQGTAARLLKGESLGELVAALNSPTPKPY